PRDTPVEYVAAPWLVNDRLLRLLPLPLPLRVRVACGPTTVGPLPDSVPPVQAKLPVTVRAPVPLMVPPLKATEAVVTGTLSVAVPLETLSVPGVVEPLKVTFPPLTVVALAL